MSKHIDAKGKSCPIPVVLAKQAIAEGHTAFTVAVDNQTAVENLKRLADSKGYSVSVQAQGDTFVIGFGTDDGASTPLPASTGDYVVFVSRDIVGSGNRELGGNLMRMFFYTLVSSDALPAAILFINDGVKLPSLDDQVVEHLTALADKGVDILVCGACLNFYGIADQLRVGVVSNMYDIVSRMQTAPKVITV